MNYDNDNRIATADYDDEIVTPENRHCFRDDEEDRTVSDGALRLLLER